MNNNVLHRIQKLHVLNRHKGFVVRHKSYFVCLDVLFVGCVFANFVSFGLTNFLLASGMFVEVNVLHDFVAGIGVSWVFKQVLLWILFTGMYVFGRRSVSTEEGLTVLIFMVLSFWIVMNWDLVNNLGHFLGMWF